MLVASLLVAFFLDRGLAAHRPADLGALAIAVGGALLAPVVVTIVAALVRGSEASVVRFGAFAVGVLLLGYMFAAGSWALRFLAELRAHAR